MSKTCKPIEIGCYLITHYNDHDPHAYVADLKAMDSEKLYKACKDTIWLSAYANNNPISDFHWMCDACYDECKRRGCLELYNRAHKAASGSV